MTTLAACLPRAPGGCCAGWANAQGAQGQRQPANIGQRMAAIVASARAGEVFVQMQKMRARHMPGCVSAPAVVGVGQLVAAVDQHNAAGRAGGQLGGGNQGGEHGEDSWCDGQDCWVILAGGGEDDKVMWVYAICQKKAY
jgi:hypothetical protein